MPTQLIVAYDDDRQPSLQMWDLRKNPPYPFQEKAGHSKGILSVSWNTMDPNLLLSCGKDNHLICWTLSSGTLETFCDMPTSQQYNFDAKWSPFKPALFSTSSMSGTVGIHSAQTLQNGSKYCPKWYKKPCGASFGFGGKMLSFGINQAAAAVTTDGKSTSSYCHSLVIPNEPELVTSADAFEQWIGDRKLRDYCQMKTQRCAQTNEHEGLMWDLMGSQFEASGRERVPKLLGFDHSEIEQRAERFLGKKPGSLLGQPQEPEAVSSMPPAATAASPSQACQILSADAADAFFC